MRSGWMRVALCTAAAALATAAPAEGQIQSNWSDVGAGTRVPAGYDDADVFDYSGGGLGDVLLSGPNMTPGVLVDTDLGQPEQVWRLNQLGAAGRAEPGDLNRDGVSDVVAVVPQLSGGQYVIRYLLSTGARSPSRGRYSVFETVVGGTSPSDVALADREGDGDLDAFVALPSTIAVLNNPGDGRLALSQYLVGSGIPPVRIEAGYLTPNARYKDFVPPTLMVQLSDNKNALAYVPDGGQVWRTVAIASPVLPGFAGPSETLERYGSSLRIAGWNGSSFTSTATLPVALTAELGCADTAVGDHLVNVMSRTYAAAVNGATPYVGLWGKPLTTGAFSEVRRILLPASAGAVCDLEFAELGSVEGGAPQHLLVLTRAGNLYVFRPSAAGGSTARSGGSGPAARLVGRRARLAADGRFALRFRCPAAVSRRAGRCGSRLRLRPSAGAVTPSDATVVVRPGATRTVRFRLSQDGVASIRRAPVTVGVRAVASTRGKVVALERR